MNWWSGASDFPIWGHSPEDPSAIRDQKLSKVLDDIDRSVEDLRNLVPNNGVTEHMRGRIERALGILRDYHGLKRKT